MLILPDDDKEWMTVTPEQLVVRRAAYWYRPASSDSYTDNGSEIRIEIPLTTAVGLDFLDERFRETYQ